MLSERCAADHIGLRRRGRAAADGGEHQPHRPPVAEEPEEAGDGDGPRQVTVGDRTIALDDISGISTTTPDATAA